MATITIPKKLIQNDDLVVIPRRKYEKFLGLEKMMERRLAEESDIDFAIKVYKEETRQGKLKIIKSLANLVR